MWYCTKGMMVKDLFVVMVIVGWLKGGLRIVIMDGDGDWEPASWQELQTYIHVYLCHVCTIFQISGL